MKTPLKIRGKINPQAVKALGSIPISGAFDPLRFLDSAGVERYCREPPLWVDLFRAMERAQLNGMVGAVTGVEPPEPVVAMTFDTLGEISILRHGGLIDLVLEDGFAPYLEWTGGASSETYRRTHSDFYEFIKIWFFDSVGKADSPVSLQSLEKDQVTDVMIDIQPHVNGRPWLVLIAYNWVHFKGEDHEITGVTRLQAQILETPPGGTLTMRWL